MSNEVAFLNLFARPPALSNGAAHRRNLARLRPDADFAALRQRDAGSRAGSERQQGPKANKSFLLLFFKKEALACFISVNAAAALADHDAVGA